MFWAVVQGPKYFNQCRSGIGTSALFSPLHMTCLVTPRDVVLCDLAISNCESHCMSNSHKSRVVWIGKHTKEKQGS